MKYSQKLKAQRAEKVEAAKKIFAVAEAAGRPMNDDETKAFDALHVEAGNLKLSIARAEIQEAADAELTALQPALIQPAPVSAPVEHPILSKPANEPKMWSRVRFARSVQEAYRFGMWAAAVLGFPWAQKKAKGMFEPLALLNEGTNTQGGYLVIEEFLNTIIDLREQYGVFRRKSKIVPMKSDRLLLPRRTGGLTAYPVGEGAVGTETTKAWDRVGLTASKWMVLTRMTSEVDEDSVVSFGDDLLGEIAYAFAVAEDGAGFNGDGTSTYAGVTGLKNALAAGAKVTQGTSNTWSAQVLADFNALMGKCPDYTIARNPEFYCNKAYYHNVMERLAMASGGVTAMEIVNGIPQGRFFGYPVNFVTVMPSATATTGITVYFGDLAAASKFGDRRQITISMSDSASVGGQSMWERDEIGIKGTERFDINIHERGTASVGGPINALITG